MWGLVPWGAECHGWHSAATAMCGRHEITLFLVVHTELEKLLKSKRHHRTSANPGPVFMCCLTSQDIVNVLTPFGEVPSIQIVVNTALFSPKGS